MYAQAWAAGRKGQRHATDDGEAPARHSNTNFAAKWAKTGSATSTGSADANYAAAWAGTKPFEPVVAEPLELEPVVRKFDCVLDSKIFEESIATITTSTTVKQLENMVQQLADNLANHKDSATMAWTMMQYDSILSKTATLGQHSNFIDAHVVKPTMAYAKEQLESTNATNRRPIESHFAESKRLGIGVKLMNSRRALGATSAIILQRELSNKFVDTMCEKIEAEGGRAETYFENIEGTKPRIQGLTLLMITTTMFMP